MKTRKTTSRSLIVTALAALALAAVASCASSEPALRKSSKVTRYPIVLVHGMAGFSKIGDLDYFLGVVDDLKEAGFEAYAPALPPYHSSKERTRHLKAAVDKILADTGAEKIHLVGHSQGGLDSRRLISKHGYGDRVASLTTLSTPHRGSPVASLAKELPELLTDGVLGLAAAATTTAAGDDLPADGSAQLETLSVEVAERYNKETPDDPRVPIFSFAGIIGSRESPRCEEAAWKMYRRPGAPSAAMLATYAAMSRGELEVANDGLVPVDSSIWGTFLGCLPADHLDIVGLGGDRLRAPDVDPFDHHVFYVDYAERLGVLDASGSIEAMIAAGPPRSGAKH